MFYQCPGSNFVFLTWMITSSPGAQYDNVFSVVYLQIISHMKPHNRMLRECFFTIFFDVFSFWAKICCCDNLVHIDISLQLCWIIDQLYAEQMKLYCYPRGVTHQALVGTFTLWYLLRMINTTDNAGCLDCAVCCL